MKDIQSQSKHVCDQIKTKQNKTKQTVSRENFITSFSGGRVPMAIVMLTRVILF